MMRTIVLAAALVAATSATACKKSSKPAAEGGSGAAPADGPPTAASAVKTLEAFRDRACACTDLACVGLAKKELADWLLKNGPELGKLTFTPAQDAAGQKASAAMDACVAKMGQSPAPQ